MENLSPVVERRSRRIGPVDHSTLEVPPEELNDDEEERSRHRKQIEEEARNQSSREKRFSASEKTLSEHFRSCIQLAAENKINIKNAFNFKLIDLLPMMFSKKKQIPDFTEVSSSLDAGIKIYSCRVDNVHSDTMKMATTICSVPNKNKIIEEDKEQSVTDEVSKKRKHVKKSNKSTIATNVDQINRNKSDEPFGISRSFLSNENFIINSAIFDNNRMCLHLNIESNFWKSGTDSKPDHSATKVSIKLPNLQHENICPTFKDFTFKGETNYHDISLKEKIQHEFNYEPTPVDDHNDDVFDDFAIPPEPNDTQPSKLNVDTTSQTASLSKVMSSSHFASDISELIASETSEYCYFNTQLLKKKWNLRSMGHWNPFMKKKESSARIRTQKNDFIDFHTFDNFKAFDDIKQPLTITSAVNREKFLITPITHFNFKEFFRLKTWRDMYVVPTSSNEEQPSDLEETINNYNYDNPNDTLNSVPHHHEDDYVDNFDDGAADVHVAMERTTLQGENLVEIPNKVAKIQLPYTIKDKSVDMKKLKSKIWHKLEPSTKPQQPEHLHFSDICQDLVTDSKTELSVPILFNAILQLANDKNLQFDPISELSDFSVRIINEVN